MGVTKNYPPQISPEIKTNEGAMEKIVSENHPVVSS